ncbi:MAG TPA: AMP-binding protein [Candidatus Agrococcus pullicola]|uniref:AMP-binding protein n=1 Tax=Candidatus Agrococcus pullicola TaxID=2838429 RepID=A0A9D1YWT2_9MICO|nr:AMP-binding protein [Candidatus Agrococcus pullicola]
MSYILETSGSSAAPKSVVLSEEAVRAATEAANERLGGPGQWVLSLPEAFVAAKNVIWRNETSGAPLVRTSGSFTAEAFVEAVETLEHDRRYTSLVPAQLARLVDAAEIERSFIAPIRRLDRILLGGQRAPAGLIEKASMLGWQVTRTYGATETCGGCVWDGRPIGDVKIRITDQIEISGPTLADGYHDEPELTEQRFYRDAGGTRWYRTGDAGALIGGQLQVSGRIDDVIVSGGMNVSLAAVEHVVQVFAADAVVVAGPDPKWGEVPVVVTTSRPSLAEIRSAVGNALGKPARPNHVVTVSAIPTTHSGKPDRRKLKRLVASRTAQKSTRRRLFG